MSTKITSVKIDKKEVMNENFKKKGLPELLSEVNFSIDTNESPGKLTKKFISAIKRKFKTEFMSMSIEDKLTFIKGINIHSIYSVEMELFNGDENVGFYKNIQELLYNTQPKALREKKEDIIIAKVTMNNGDTESVGYGILNSEIGSSYHRTHRGYPSTLKKYGYQKLLDIPTLIAETIIAQSLMDFAEKNKEVVQYLFVEQNLKKTMYPKAPKLLDFKDDYMGIAEKYNIKWSAYRESEELDKFENVFYVKKKEVGTSRNPLDDYLFQLIIAEFIQQSEYVQYKTNEELKERSEYAKAFQTKKQIKKTHLERMEKNAFLGRYGYVELDNDVDLKKFRIIEDNFKELCEKIYVPKRKDYSFRIKKLGKHRAAGVFFPYYKTTIFDLNHPDAFVHELWHQIDAIMAEDLSGYDYFSETLEFREVFDKYKELITNHVESLPSEHAFKQQWTGKTKFNKSYYLKPTEVLARSGEVYIASLGINNSLTKSKEELEKNDVYSFEVDYLKSVTTFFDTFINDLKKKEHVPTVSLQIEESKKDLRSAAGRGEIEKINVEPENFEQLSLF